ncbi:RrF2 family transcriptional regulator [Rosettibacter firmus]|uniref:RrF2 family transcriptional regulator n=1 Tax=Rosettibacter firmus TaxID=3111522 RepID=UPI00336BBBAC
MTVFFSKACELGIQAVLYLSIKKQNVIVSADEISQELKVPKEFVSKILQKLTYHGITGSKKGKGGGFYLAKNPGNIRLIDIIEAIDGLDIFKSCVLGFPGCSNENPCPVHDKWGKLREEAYKMFSEETLSQLKEKTIQKILNL